MANIIKTTDFVSGELKLSQNSYNSTDLAAFIAEHEKFYLESLLNPYLYNLLVADLSVLGVPQTQKYKDLVNGITYTDEGSCKVNYQGIAKMLKFFIWYEFTKSDAYNSNVGNVQAMTENAKPLTEYDLKRIAYERFNKGNQIYRDTIKFLNDDTYYLTYFTATEYNNWQPKIFDCKSFLKTKTYSAPYFLNKKSTENDED